MTNTNIAPETPKRHTGRELIEASQELVATPAIAHRLGHYAVKLAAVLERCEYTEIRDDGFIESPPNPDAIPLVPRLMGEAAVLRATDSGMTTPQRQAIDAKYGAGKGATINKKFVRNLTASEKHQDTGKFTKPDQLGVTANNTWSSQEITIHGRPVISMNLESAVNGRLSPVVLLHELTHVIQKEERPIRKKQEEGGPRSRLTNELEAYYVADCVIQGHKDMGRQADLLGHTARHEVDKARHISGILQASQNGSSIDFYPSNDLINGLAEKDLIDEEHHRDLLAAAS